MTPHFEADDRRALGEAWGCGVAAAVFVFGLVLGLVCFLVG